jgi:hypothetical protein
VTWSGAVRGAGGAGRLDRFVCSWVYTECTLMLNIGVI